MSRLKIGLLLDGKLVPSWTYSMIRKIVESDYAEIALVVENIPAVSKKSILGKIRSSFDSILYRLYMKYETRMFKIYPDAFERRDISSLLSKIDILTVVPESTKTCDRLNEADLGVIKSHDLDVMIKLGFKVLTGDILSAAKYGIWSFHHGDDRVHRGGPAGVWEVFDSWNETGVTLQILTEDSDGGAAIERSYYCTDNISIRRNSNVNYWRAVSIILRNLKKLHALGGETFMRQLSAANKDPYFYYERLFTGPSNYELVKHVIAKYLGIVRQRIDNLFHLYQWILMISVNKSGTLSQSLSDFKKVIPPKDRFWADPFVVYRDEKHFVFIEEFLFSRMKAHISVLTVDEKGEITTPIKILEKDYHLSYPFVFEDRGDYYMIPETCENKTIELYRCIEFPHRWQFQATLMNNIAARDTTVHFHNNKYWLFCSIDENQVGPMASTGDELFIFYSDELISQSWQPHAQNPVISDVKKARPAGKIFQFNGEYYRPSQNCSKRYGRGMHIAKILLLSENQYEEESVQFIYPNWDRNLFGTHTLNSAGKLTIIDALYRRRR
jgi:hypothetical protein